MIKKKKIIITIVFLLAALAIVMTMKMKQSKTLAEIMQGENIVESFSIEYKAKENGEYNILGVDITDKKDIEEIWNVLEETEISSMKFSTPPKTLEEGISMYEIEELYNKHWIQIMSSGEVRTGIPGVYQIELVYTISEEERLQCISSLEKIMQNYEVKSN